MGGCLRRASPPPRPEGSVEYLRGWREGEDFQDIQGQYLRGWRDAEDCQAIQAQLWAALAQYLRGWRDAEDFQDIQAQYWTALAEEERELAEVDSVAPSTPAGDREALLEEEFWAAESAWVLAHWDLYHPEGCSCGYCSD